MACDRDPGPKMSGPGGSVMRDRTNGRNSTVDHDQQYVKTNFSEEIGNPHGLVTAI